MSVCTTDTRKIYARLAEWIRAATSIICPGLVLWIWACNWVMGWRLCASNVAHIFLTLGNPLLLLHHFGQLHESQKRDNCWKADGRFCSVQGKSRSNLELFPTHEIPARKFTCSELRGRNFNYLALKILRMEKLTFQRWWAIQFTEAQLDQQLQDDAARSSLRGWRRNRTMM